MASNYPLTKVKLLPYLGAGSTEDEGFALVPDGNGGIITSTMERIGSCILYGSLLIVQ